MRRIPEARTLVSQLTIVFAIVAIGVFLVDATLSSLRARGVSTGFAFLGSPVYWSIDHTWMEFIPGVSTYGRALLIGLSNTLTVSLVVIVLSTVLGTALGIARLSPNWLLARTAGVYVEVTRNVPVLLQLVFWYQLLLKLPPPRQAIPVAGGIFASSRGIHLPTASVDIAIFAILCGAVAVAIALPRLLRPRGLPVGTPLWPWSLGLSLSVLVAVFWLAGPVFVVEWPRLQGFNFRGGATVTPEFSALVLGLTIYTSAFVAEIVRAGIQGIPAGQWDAARALGLGWFLTLRKVIIPQTLRIIVPPLTNEYLGATKSSSLAVAVGYPDLIALVNTTISDTGQAIEGFVIVMLAFLAISLGVSAFMNWYNARIALVTR